MAQDYEAPALRDQYLLFHYGEADMALPFAFGPTDALNFPERVVEEMVADHPDDGRALDIGCAVGRSSFALSRNCAEVIGIDYSASFVESAERIRTEGSLPYTVIDEGEIARKLTAQVPEHAHPNRIRFETGDAMNLNSGLGAFDVVLLLNVICRLPEPAVCLKRIHEFVKPDGQLIVSSPYTWMEEYTSPEHWLRSIRESRGDAKTLHDFLDEHFTLEEMQDLPFLIREHRRKYQWCVPEVTRWRRK